MEYIVFGILNKKCLVMLLKKYYWDYGKIFCINLNEKNIFIDYFNFGLYFFSFKNFIVECCFLK